MKIKVKLVLYMRERDNKFVKDAMSLLYSRPIHFNSGRERTRFLTKRFLSAHK